MASLFERFIGRKEPSSAEVAKERLKLVLVTDRSNLSPIKLAEMQAEIIEVIKRYIPIDDTEVQIKFEQRDRESYLVADIPLHRERAYEALDEPTEPQETASAAASDPAPETPAAETLEDDSESKST